MVTATPIKFAVGNDTTQLTEPIIFNPPMAKKTEKPQKSEVSLGSVSTSMTLIKAIIGIFVLLRLMTKETLFSIRKKNTTSKRRKSKKRTNKFRLRNCRKLNIPPIISNITP